MAQPHSPTGLAYAPLLGKKTYSVVCVFSGLLSLVYPGIFSNPSGRPPVENLGTL